MSQTLQAVRGMNDILPDEAETWEYFESIVRDWLASFYFSLSGDAPADLPSFAIVPRGTRLRDRLRRPERLPAWLSEADLDFYVAEFERTGFTGALNRYRNIDRDWEDLAPFEDRPIEIPALFIGGSRDGPRAREAGKDEPRVTTN